MHIPNLLLSTTTLFLTSTLASPGPAPIATPAPELLQQRQGCSADNCLRGLRNRISAAVPFCSTYTTSAEATIPTWATAQCQSNPTRVSSACNCLATAPLQKVYGPVDHTNYTIFSQAENINSRPGVDPEEFFNQCFNMCSASGSRCQTFSFAQMPNFQGAPGGLFLCYQYMTQFQPELVASAANWTGNVVYTR